MQKIPKYVFDENDVMVPNPAHPDNQKQTTLARPEAIPIISSMADVKEAQDAQELATGKKRPMAKSTAVSMQRIMEDPEYIKDFDSSVDGNMMLEGLTNFFSKHEVPIGLINKLQALSEFKLHYIIDDSTSMDSPTQVSRAKATDFISKSERALNLTRWEEAHNRIHLLLDIFAYTPCLGIKISFLNNKDTITLSQKNQTPESFLKNSHEQVRTLFNDVHNNRQKGLKPRTPLYPALEAAFQDTDNTIVCPWTDGEPNYGGGVDAILRLLKNRDAQKFPVSLMSCTDDEGADWMKAADQSGVRIAEIDDFESESLEVSQKQGLAFHYTYGMYLVSATGVAAICPHDLDALDEDRPLSKMTFENMLGMKLTEAEYEHYWKLNPFSDAHSKVYDKFLTEQMHALKILERYAPDLLPDDYANKGAILNQYNSMNHSTPAWHASPPPYDDDYKSAKNKY